MEHHFDKDFAVEYGLDEAIMLNHLIFWIDKNRANKRNFINGYHWTYSSYKAFTEIFPYWKELKIKRILDSLVKQEVILRENHNKAGYDRTCWYALKNEESIFQKRNIHISKMKDASFRNERPIPYNLTYNNTYINNKELSFFSSEYENLWLEWKEYKQTEFKERFKTTKSEQVAINQLQKISNNDIVIAKEIVNLSIANRWKGLFKLKTEKTTKQNGKTTSDYYRENYERNLKWANEWDIVEGRQPFSTGSEE